VSTVRRAVIDVGTNSVKLLVADLDGRRIEPVLEDSRQTRLGRGFYEARRLQPLALAQTALAVGEFFRAAKKMEATTVRVIATSAARDAQNAAELVATLERATGASVEVISGEQEAELAFRGAMTNPKLSREPVLLLDVGGGSTEFILGQAEAIHFHQSFSMGAVRLLEQLPHSDPPRAAELAACRDWLKSFVAKTIRPAIEPARQREVRTHAQHHAVRLVGVGGTATVLAKLENGMNDYDREQIEATRLTARRVHEWCERLWSLPWAERRIVPGMPKDRADVMLTGVLIYEAVMQELDFPELRASTRGLRFAAVLEAN
jgi:exopolyphosphatase/guanosine-5'-triphosphate,3'-diphosphate pyrophosphatase